MLRWGKTRVVEEVSQVVQANSKHVVLGIKMELRVGRKVEAVSLVSQGVEPCAKIAVDVSTKSVSLNGSDRRL